jgi:hypothetical protein
MDGKRFQRGCGRARGTSLKSRRCRRLVVTALAVSASSWLASRALATNWTGADGTDSWSDPLNWSSGVPAANSLANITSSFTVFNVNYDYTGAAVTLNSLVLDLTNGSGASDSLTMAADNLTTEGEFLGDSSTGNGSGLLNQSGGSNAVIENGALALGFNPTDTGTYVLSNAGSLTANNEFVGYQGMGIFNQTGGTNTISIASNPNDNNYFFDVGFGTGTTGTYTLSGTGAVVVSGVGMQEYIGGSGVGTFIQNGGAHTVSGGDSIDVGSNGTYLLNGGSLLISGNEIIGGSSGHTATFTQTGGTNTETNGNLYVGFTSGLFGVYNLGGSGTFTASGTTEIIGFSGVGILNQTGGVNTVSLNPQNKDNFMALGYNPGATGTYVLSGGSASITPNLFVGEPGSSGRAGGVGVLTVSGVGTLTVNGTLSAYNTPGSAVNLSGGTIIATALDFNGTPSLLNWTSGTLDLTSNVTFDPGAAASSTSAAFGPSLTVGANQTLIVTGNETLGGTSPFSLTVNSGGTHSVTGELTVNSNGTLNQSGGASTVGGVMNAGSISIGAGGSLVVNGGFNQTGGLTTVHGLLTVNSNSISITANAVDVSNGEMLVNYGSSPDPISTIQSYLATGYNGGAWNGTGIISSAVSSANSTQSALMYSVGYADGSDGLTGVPSGEIEILPTLAGDAKLLGNVNFGDFQLLAQYFGHSSTTWDEGDFTYSGSTTFGDFQLLAQDFGSTNSALTASELASLNSFAAQFGDALLPNPDGAGFQVIAVPEPASAVLIGAGGLLLLRRRRDIPRAGY